MESWQDEIIKAQISQEIGVERSMENSDTSIFLKSFEDNLISCVDRDSFDKSWSGDLAKKFPEGGWRTINGASVFINNGKVIAGLDGFNKEIDTFFEQKGKKTEGKKREESKLEERTNKLLKEYYEKDKKPKEKFVKMGVSESTAKIEAKKRGEGFEVKPDENEKGKFKVVHTVKGEAEGMSFDQYKGKYGKQLEVTAKNQLDYEESEGSNVNANKELLNELNESHKTGKELSDNFYDKFTKLSKEDQSRIVEATDSHKTAKDKREALEKILRSGKEKPKTTEKEENKGEITIDTFVDIAKKSKDVKDFMRKVVAIKGVPSSVANEFQNKYGNGGELTMEQASQNFMDVAKGKEKEVTKEKPQEPRTKRESKSSKANKRMHSLEGYKSSKSDADSINSYKELNKITKELDPKLMSSKDKESEAKLIEEIQENFWSPDDSDRSKELSDVVWNSNSIKESMDAVNKLQRIASKTDYSVLDDKTMDKIKDGVATMLQNQINKKETERLNYKLF